MTEGVLSIQKNNIYVSGESGNVPVCSGQYMYLNIQECWVPVIIAHSDKTGKWYFRYLENLKVNGQKVAVE